MNIELSKLIDLSAWQKLMESLFKATGINHALLDLDNNVLAAAGWQRVCTDFHRVNPVSCQRCKTSDSYITEHLSRAEPYVGYRCLNGLYDYATPVRIDGKHVANIFTGQMFHQAPDLALFREQARCLGFDEEAYLDAIDKVTITAEEKMPAIMSFLADLAEMLGENGLLHMQQLNIENKLERKIAERTAELVESQKQLNELNRKLEILSVQDGLTGIANRRMFDVTLHREWGRCMREQCPLSLVMIDIDFFKGYNDYYGHLQGDECLKRVALELEKVLKRTMDLCARYGGEEFALLLPNTNTQEASFLAENCRENIARLNIPYEKSTICDVVTISAGVASIVPHKGMQSTALIEAADKALYLAKANGRNRVETSLQK